MPAGSDRVFLGGQPVRGCLRGSRAQLDQHGYQVAAESQHPQALSRGSGGVRHVCWTDQQPPSHGERADGTLVEVRYYECDGYVEGGGRKSGQRRSSRRRKRRHCPEKHEQQQQQQQHQISNAVATEALAGAGAGAGADEQNFVGCAAAGGVSAAAGKIPAGVIVCRSPLYACSIYAEHRKRVCSRCLHVSASRLVEKCTSCDQAWWCSRSTPGADAGVGGGGATGCDARASELGHRIAPHAAVCPALQRFNTMASRFGKDTTSMLRLVLEVLYFRT